MPYRPMSSLKNPTLLLAALLALGCSRPASEDDGTTDSTEADATSEIEEAPAKEPVLVRTSGLSRGRVERILESTASVQSLDVVEVMPERAEPVIEILVEEGDQVVAKQILARLRDDNARLAVAEAEVRVLETKQAMEQAQREFERDQKLVEEEGPTGVLSDRDLETRRQTWDASKTAHESTIVARDRALLDLKQCTLRTPIAGTVSVRDISLGDMASVGTRVFEITDLSKPKVILYRPQRELMDLKVGQRLVATSDALPGLQIPGYIERIAPTVDLTTGTVKVTAALDPTEVTVPPGILVKLTLVLDAHDDALLLPKEALMHEAGAVYCYVVKDGIAHRREVVQGFSNDDSVEAAEGTDIAEDDVVIVVGGDRIGDGDPVEIAEE